MDDIIYKCVLISICFTGFCLNFGVLIRKLCLRKWNRTNTFFTINLTVTNIFASTFLLILSINAINDIARNNKTAHLKLQNNNLCKIATFIQNFAYEAKLGFLFLKCWDMIKSVRDNSTVNGLGVTKLLGFGILVWFLSVLVTVVQFVPLSYFQNEVDFEEIPGELCSHIESLHNRTAGWEYSFGLHIGFNGLIYLACIVMVITTIVLKKHSSFGQLTDSEHKEQLFLAQTAILCLVDFICWTPSILLGAHVLISHIRSVTLLSGDAVRWVTLLTTSIHTIINPIVVVATAPKSSSYNVPGVSQNVSTNSRSWTSARNTSVKLSKYLETVGALSPQETVVMTASLSRSLGNLYKLGLTTSIDPEYIYMEHDEFGTVINSHLTGIPRRPTAEQMQKDNSKIAELFESMMQRLNDKRRRTPNGSFKSKASVKVKHSLSMKESSRLRRVQSRLRTNSERNFKSAHRHAAASMPNIYTIGGVDDLARRVDTLRKKNERFSLKLHSTISLSVDSDYSFGDSYVPTNSGQSEESVAGTPEDENENAGRLDVIVESNNI